MKKSVEQSLKFLSYLKEGRFFNPSPIFYSEMAKVVGSHPHAMGWALGHIQDACVKLDLPPLQALVINKSTRRPGYSYMYSRFGYSSAVIKQVREYKWDFDRLTRHIAGRSAQE